MAGSRVRRVAVLIGVWTLAAIPLAGGAAAPGSSGSRPPVAPQAVVGASYAFLAQPTIALGVDTAARTAITWRGGRITVASGEVVRVFVSQTLPAETTSPEQWAEYLSGLTHGPELALLTAYIAPIAEVQEICGARALGCYARNQMVAPAEPVAGILPEEIVRHEYGHHVASHRQNPPWPAIDWGPKHWASTANVCARTARGEAHPGDQGSNYALNPGEAWAETYRVMDERKAGILTGSWQIVAPSFFPNETALEAAERDVLQPWTRPTVRSFQRAFGPRTARVWWIPVSTPLDGQLRLTVSLPRGGAHDVALVAPNRRTVVQRAQPIGPRARRAQTTVCGQRNLFVRITQSGSFGPVRVSVTTP